MKTFTPTVLSLGVCVLAMLPGCIDDNYDLSDIDTTSKFTVNDLQIPVNLDAIKLDNVFKLDDDANFKVVTVGDKQVYAFSSHGRSISDPIHIGAVHADAPDLVPSTGYLYPVPITGNYTIKAPIADMSPVGYQFDFSQIDGSIYELYSATTKPVVFTISLNMPDTDNVTKVCFENISFKMPKGLTATASKGTYDAETGILWVPEISGAPKDMKIDVTATGVNFLTAGVKLDYATHSFSFADEFKVLGGNMLLDLNGVPSSILFEAALAITPIDATNITGRIQYKIDGVNIDPISLGSIPSFLLQDGTNLLLTNPQIYMHLNNPVGRYDASCTTGITLQSVRAEGDSPVYSIDEGTFTIPSGRGEGPYNFVLAPKMPQHPLPDFADHLELIRFTDLTKAIGDGPVPSSLNITLHDPQIPMQDVTGFPINLDLPAVDVNWEVLAPLNLEAGSMVVYSGEETGWNDEDVDAIVIERLAVSALTTSTIPVEIYVTAEPLDVNGNVIDNVKIEGAKLPANATDYPLEIKISGEVRHLDGIRYKAYLLTDKTTGDITPDQGLDLKNIRVRVSGNWIKEL